MKAIDDRSVQEKVLQRIRDAILDGTLAPGSPLRIDALAERLKVSHMPVRRRFSAKIREGILTGTAICDTVTCKRIHLNRAPR